MDTKKVLQIAFMSVLVILPLPNQAQNLSEEEQAGDSTQVYPHAEVHIGAGLTSGGRVGMRIRYESFSIEAAFGNVLQNFVGLSDEDRRLTLGMNWYPIVQSNLALSFLVVTRVRPGLSSPRNYFDDLYFSLNAGSLPFRKKGFGIFLRGGFTFAYLHEPTGGPKKFSFHGPNIDVGVFFVLF